MYNTTQHCSLTVSSAHEFVRLFIKIDIILRSDAKHSVTTISLVNMIDVVKTVRTKMLQHERPNVVDVGQLEDTTQINYGIEGSHRCL